MFYDRWARTRRGWSGALFLCACATTCLAQPVMSRGQQQISVNYNECLSRAQRALSAVGFTTSGAGNFAQGFKEASGAYIICNEAPGGGMVVNIVVSTIANDDGVPGRLRQCLQEQMATPGARSACAGGRCTPAGTWNWLDGDRVVINPDGTVRGFHGNGSPSNDGSWVGLGGNRYRLSWRNGGWTDTLTLSADGTTMDGTNNVGRNVHVTCATK